MVDLYDRFVNSNRGQAAWPMEVPPAMDSFIAMPDNVPGLEMAWLNDVYQYLRRGKHLQIPVEWRHLIPKP